jgi:hypothetical protein
MPESTDTPAPVMRAALPGLRKFAIRSIAKAGETCCVAVDVESTA